MIRNAGENVPIVATESAGNIKNKIMTVLGFWLIDPISELFLVNLWQTKILISFEKHNKFMLHVNSYPQHYFNYLFGNILVH